MKTRIGYFVIIVFTLSLFFTACSVAPASSSADTTNLGEPEQMVAGGDNDDAVIPDNPPGTPSAGEGNTNDTFTVETMVVDPGTGVSQLVLWTITSFVRAADSKMSNADANTYITKPLDISENGIVFDGQVCSDVFFTESTVKSADYLASMWQTDAKSLGFDFAEFKVIKTNCELLGFKEYIRLPDRRLVVPFEGVFFFFDPAVTY